MKSTRDQNKMSMMAPCRPILAQFIIAQKLLCETGYFPFLVKFFLEGFGAGRDRHGAETPLIDEV
jgi:hypothetical protein